MSKENLQPLSLGLSTFTRLRSGDAIYVDKTDLIYDLASDPRFYFLSRPRRFGKTLLINTFESLFLHGLRDFEGLKIADKWQDKTYKVLHLDFSAAATFNDEDKFIWEFYRMLTDAMSKAGIPLEKEDTELKDTVVTRFLRTLSYLPTDSLVLLVDEYDAPLNVCLEKPKLFDKVRMTLEQFYYGVKANSDCLHFMFITGISRHSNTGIFSAFNSLKDLTLDQNYGTLLGYTEEEIRFYFKAHLSHAAEVLLISVDECIARLKENYDGFCFDRNIATHVFNPWSVLSFLSSPVNGFINYWYSNSGSPSVLLNYLKGHSLKTPEQYGRDQILTDNELTSSMVVNELSDLGLLTQTGYLTLKGHPEGSSDFIVNYPNRELAMSMAQLYADKMPEKSDLKSFCRIFLNGSPDEIIGNLNAFIGRMSYERFPLKDEYSIQSLLHLALMAAGFSPDIEVKNAHGRSDLELRAANRYFVLELKYAREDQDADKLLEAAVEQIKSRHYGEYNYPELEHVRIALVFSQQQRAFVKWTILD